MPPRHNHFMKTTIMKPTHILSILALTFVLAEATPCGAQQYNFTTFAGSPSGAGSSDGTSSAARFRWPAAVALDKGGQYLCGGYLESHDPEDHAEWSSEHAGGVGGRARQRRRD